MVEARWPSYTVLPFLEEMGSRIREGGSEALLGMPADYWVELGAFGTIDDAHQHVAALDRVGVDVAVGYPAVAFGEPSQQVALVAEIAGR